MASRFSVEAVFKAIDKFTAPVSAMQNRIGKFTRAIDANFKAVNRTINKVSGSLYNVGKTAAKWTAAGVAALTLATVGLMHEFSKVEDATANFTPLMGGVENARKLVDELNKAAAVTPFRFEDLAGVAQQLLPVMNGDIQNTIKTMKMLGDTSGGNAQKLDTITRGFTKAMLKGKVDLESLNMIGEAGVPIFTELAASMGKKVNPAFFKMISAGKVTTAQLTKAFEKMTSEGGIFFGGMEIASKTTTGMWSSMMDEIGMTAAALGEILAPTVKELIAYVTELAQKARAWVAANREFIRSKFIEYVTKAREMFAKFLEKFNDVNKTAGMLDSIVNALLMVAKGIGWLFEHAAQIGRVGTYVLVLVVAFKALAAIMAVVNILMLANPIGLITLAIMAAIAAIAALIIWWDDLVAAFKTLPDWVQNAVGLFVAPIMLLIDAVKLLGSTWDWVANKFQSAGRWLGLIGDSSVDVNQNTNATNSTEPLVISPQQRNAQAIDETRSTSSAELLIKDSTGRAELTKNGSAPGIRFDLMQTGGF